MISLIIFLTDFKKGEGSQFNGIFFLASGLLIEKHFNETAKYWTYNLSKENQLRKEHYLKLS